MLEKIDLNKKMSKQEYSESLPKIEAELGRLQRECKDLDIPVTISLKSRSDITRFLFSFPSLRVFA